ncbi:hypothetical protein M427DRAFT_286914 [Gonapodya prolifera JEL478]|uniref:C2H2-type domain-containing protein n=1 Tax=Gonapodya prolifera (strain JEL478) TaxID=1344416 RepID=A0A139AJB2_GONPJ|nr:hypothetical protein M427DRAFT_286914 [Gonapodya prolifera JEL478]|eukprot:KXS16886.1 hypothetical protein M427DRAFT_286914 [Gonapodya prolifera JEL478]
MRTDLPRTLRCTRCGKQFTRRDVLHRHKSRTCAALPLLPTASAINPVPMTSAASVFWPSSDLIEPHLYNVDSSPKISSFHERCDNPQFESQLGFEGQSKSLGNFLVATDLVLRRSGPDQPATSHHTLHQHPLPPTQELPPIQHHPKTNRTDIHTSPSALLGVPFLLEPSVSLTPEWRIPFGV